MGLGKGKGWDKVKRKMCHIYRGVLLFLGGEGWEWGLGKGKCV